VANVVADALSWRDWEAAPSILALSAPTFELFDDLRQAFIADQALRSMQEEVERGDRGTNWCIKDSLILVDGCVYIPANSPSAVLHGAHGAGHEGVAKTLHRLQTDFHLPGARAIVQDFVRTCEVCQRNKTEHLQPVGLLCPLELPSAVWADVAYLAPCPSP
jgi:hypothetical protein